MKDLANWTACKTPGLAPLTGDHAMLEPYDCAAHAPGLFDVVGGEANHDLWRYMPVGPFCTIEAMADLLARGNVGQGWQTMVIRSASTAEILGMASYMRIRKAHGSAEVGAVAFNKKLQRTTAATEAMYLMAKHVFEDLGYRRYEWKCNAANDASKQAALRFGFKFEGVFRNDIVMKGENRDTAWFSMIDSEWPGLRKGFVGWLSPANFDEGGRQRENLARFRAA